MIHFMQSIVLPNMVCTVVAAALCPVYNWLLIFRCVAITLLFIRQCDEYYISAPFESSLLGWI